ncbi:MAG: hypothetical protein MHM6MM_005575 [Cercozoa sp. M6MM]
MMLRGFLGWPHCLAEVVFFQIVRQRRPFIAMDLAIELADRYILNEALYSNLPTQLTVPPQLLAFADQYLGKGVISPTYGFEEGDFWRQVASVYIVYLVGGYLLYLSVAGLTYWYLRVVKKEKFFGSEKVAPNIKGEIWRAVTALPWMALYTLLMVMPSVRGYSRLYNNVSDYGVPYLLLSLVMFLLFTDTGIYWIHRGLHWGPFYKYIHKDHHRWVKSMSPFASHAFAPEDGVLQSVPYHLFIYLFPMHKIAYLCMFVIVNCWTISIHDMIYVSDTSFILGAAHHSVHHLDFNYNYGQYFTFWDRLCGTHRSPPHLRHVFSKEDPGKKARPSIPGYVTFTKDHKAVPKQPKKLD